MWVGGGAGWKGIKRGEWDNGNNTINKIYFKKTKYCGWDHIQEAFLLRVLEVQILMCKSLINFKFIWGGYNVKPGYNFILLHVPIQFS